MTGANCVGLFHLFYTNKQPDNFAAQFKNILIMQTKQENNKPKWMDMDELCAYLPSHPAKQTVYGWVSAKQIPVHKINKALAFLQSEIDEWLKSKSCKSENDLMREAEEFINSKKGKGGVWR